MLKELLWASYPYRKSQGEKWIWFSWFTEWGGGQWLGSTLCRQSNRAGKHHSDPLHRHIRHELPCPSRLSLPLPPKGSIKAPETKFSLCTAENEENHSPARIFSPKVINMVIGSRVFNSMGKIPLSSAFLGMANFTDVAEVVSPETEEQGTSGALRPQEMFQGCSLFLQLSPISYNPKSSPTEFLPFSLAGTVTYTGKHHRKKHYSNITNKGTKWRTELGESAVSWRSQTCWQSHGGLVPTTQAMVLPMVLVSCWLCWVCGWGSITWTTDSWVQLLCIFVKNITCHPFLQIVDCFHPDPFGIPKDCPDSRMKNACNFFPYLIAFPHLSLMS